MARSHLTRRLARSTCALAASAYILLAIAAAAQARPADTWPQPVMQNSPAPTVHKKTVLRPASSGPDTSANAVHWHHRPSASHPSITFTNPLGRSRGPGAGAGLL
jgi:hypothetical protein